MNVLFNILITNFVFDRLQIDQYVCGDGVYTLNDSVVSR